MTREKQRIEEAKNRFSDDQIYPISKMFVFIQGAKWADETMIDKACEWLENNFVCFLQGAKRGIYSNQFITVNEMIDNFKRTMEE